MNISSSSPGMSVGMSGINSKQIIQQLVQLEYSQRIQPKISQKNTYQNKIDAYSKLQSLISKIGTKGNELSRASAFSLYTETSSDESIATISAGTGSEPGSYEISSYHLAQSEKMITGDGLITDQNASLSSLGITTGTIAIDGTELTIDNDDTIKDLRDKINNATDSNGEKLNVNASILQLSDTNYRMVLTAKETGADGVSYEDISGSTLQDLGIIQNAAGDKGNVTQTITSDNDLSAVFSGLADGETISYSGTDHKGETVQGTFTKTSSSTMDDLRADVEETFHGMVTTSINAGGQLVVTDAITGESQLSIDSFNAGGSDHAFSTTTTGLQGSGVLRTGTDAYMSIDGIMLQNSTNEIDSVISDATISLNGTSYDNSTQVSVTRDKEAIAGKVKELLNAYNSLIDFKDNKANYGDPEAENNTQGVLAGDMTLDTVISRLRTAFQNRFDVLDDSYSTLTSIGIETDYNTGKLELDEDKFDEALTDNFSEVVELFITKGTSDNANISYGRSKEATESHTYELRETADDQQIELRIQGESTWYTSDTRVGDIVAFSDGPAQGLSITAPAGSIADGTTSTFSLSKGLGAMIDDITDRMTSADNGIISNRQDTLRSNMERIEDRISQLEDRISSYEERLVKQFTAMEQNIAELQSQGTSLSNAFAGSGLM